MVEGEEGGYYTDSARSVGAPGQMGGRTAQGRGTSSSGVAGTGTGAAVGGWPRKRGVRGSPGREGKDWAWSFCPRLHSGQRMLGAGVLCGFAVSAPIPLASQLPQHEAGVGGWCRRSAREPVARRQLPKQPHPLHLHVLGAAPQTSESHPLHQAARGWGGLRPGPERRARSEGWWCANVQVQGHSERLRVLQRDRPELDHRKAFSQGREGDRPSFEQSLPELLLMGG